MIADEKEKNTADSEVQNTFPIVGVGASAGGLQAFATLLQNLPDDPGMAFVLIQHLDPHHESELAEILQTHTKMPVAQVHNQEVIQPNCVYVITPGHSLSFVVGALHLSEPVEPR
jgi:two-component system CheB/CheR fusion protein